MWYSSQLSKYFSHCLQRCLYGQCKLTTKKCAGSPTKHNHEKNANLATTKKNTHEPNNKHAKGNFIGTNIGFPGLIKWVLARIESAYQNSICNFDLLIRCQLNFQRRSWKRRNSVVWKVQLCVRIQGKANQEQSYCVTEDFFFLSLYFSVSRNILCANSTAIKYHYHCRWQFKWKKVEGCCSIWKVWFAVRIGEWTCIWLQFVDNMLAQFEGERQITRSPNIHKILIVILYLMAKPQMRNL